MSGAFRRSVQRVVGSVSGNLSHPVYGRRTSAPGPQGAGRETLRLDTAPLSLALSLSICSLFPGSACKVPLPAYQHPPGPEQTFTRLSRDADLEKKRGPSYGRAKNSTTTPPSNFLVSTCRCNCSCVVTSTVSGGGMEKSRKEECFVSTKTGRGKKKSWSCV